MRKKFGISLVSIFGIIWLASLVRYWCCMGYGPPFAGAYGLHLADVASYAISQGLLQTFVIVVAGIVIYFVSRWYNTKRGIDVSMLFKTVPPE